MEISHISPTLEYIYSLQAQQEVDTNFEVLLPNLIALNPKLIVEGHANLNPKPPDTPGDGVNEEDMMHEDNVMTSAIEQTLLLGDDATQIA